MIITITTSDGETIAISPEQHEIHTITGDEEKIAAVLSLIDDMRDNLGQIFAIGRVPDVETWDKLMQDIRKEAETILKG